MPETARPRPHTVRTKQKPMIPAGNTLNAHDARPQAVKRDDGSTPIDLKKK
jgi:hypothetical protein